MSAYLIARVKINDPVEYKKYTALTPEIMAKHGGKTLAKGGRHQVTEGTDKFNRFVVIEFPSFEAATKCIESDEYQQASSFRRKPGVAEFEQVIVDAGEV